MSRTTQTMVPLYLKPAQAARLRELAAKHDCTQQELLRRAVARILDAGQHNWFMPWDIPPDKMVEGARAFLADRAERGETAQDCIDAYDGLLGRLNWQRGRGLPEVGALADRVKADFDANAGANGIDQAQADRLWEYVVELAYARNETSKVEAWKAALIKAAGADISQPAE